MTNEEVYKEYQDSFKHLLSCTSRVNMFLFKELQKIYPNEMPYISSRTKTVESVAFKVEQMINPPDSILKIHDVIGVRIVCLTETIVDEVSKLIPTWLNIIDIKNTKIRLGEDRFGYTSIHLIGELTIDDNNHIRQPDDVDFTGLKYEVQVRTFSQHIFADLSHKYSYKSGKFIPSNIKRPLFRIAALSETIDQEINRFEEERIKYIDNYTPDPEEQITLDNLKLYFNGKLEDFRNIDDKEDYDGLIRDLNHFGIKAIGDLDRLIDKHYADFLTFEKRRLEDMIEMAGKDNEFIQKFVQGNYIYSFVGVIRGILNQEFKTTWVNYKQDAIDKPMWELIRKMIK